MIEIFKTGLIEYDKADADKPVKYRPQDLMAIASATNHVDLTKEHTNEVIGVLKNFTYKDGFLYADEPEGIDLKGFGISPSFVFALKDMGDHYVPYNIQLTSAGLTKNPRSQIFYNSITTDNGDGNLEEKEKLLKDIQANQEEIRNQREEIGILRNRNKALDESLQAKANLEQELKDKETELNNLKAQMEKIKANADAYAKIENDKKEELINKLSNDDIELREKYSKMSLEDLEFWSEKNILSTKVRGVGSHEGEEDDGTEFVRADDADPTYDDYLEFKQRQGLR